MPKNIEQKKQMINEIKQSMQQYNVVFVIGYKNLSVNEENEIRKNIKIQNAKYKIFKNTLIKKVFNELNINIDENDFIFQIGLVFAYEETQIAKILFNLCNKYGEKLIVKCAYINKERYDKNAVQILSKIGTKDVLYTNLVCTLKNIIAGFVDVLRVPISNIVYTIQEIANKKSECV